MFTGPEVRRPVSLEPQNISPVLGFNTPPAIASLSFTKPIDTHHSGQPSMNSRVPSIGSTTHTREAHSLLRSSSSSSDSQPSPVLGSLSNMKRLMSRSREVVGSSPREKLTDKARGSVLLMKSATSCIQLLIRCRSSESVVELIGTLSCLN